MSKKIIIACIDTMYGLGKNNDLLYHIPADMKHFKETTAGNTVIMGYMTYVSLGSRPLPNRRNIVISEQPLTAEGIEVVSTLDEAFKISENDEKVYVIGGAYTYKQAIEFVDELDITLVETVKTADVYFPSINNLEWTCVKQDFHNKSESNSGGYNYVFNTYTRNV